MNDIFIRPERKTPRPSFGELERLKALEPFGWTEDGEVIGRSLDDKLDEAYADGVRAGLERDREEFGDSSLTRNANEDPEQSYRRGYQQGAGAIFKEIEGQLDLQTRKRLQRFIYNTLTDWRWQRRLRRHIHKNRPPSSR